MSTTYKQKLHYIDGYRLPIEQLQKMSTQRLLNYIKKILKPRSRSYCCDCGCGEFYFELFASRKGEKSEYNKLNRYTKFVYGIINTRTDREEIYTKQDLKTAKKKQNNFGCQTKTHSVRKKERREKSRS